MYARGHLILGEQEKKPVEEVEEAATAFGLRIVQPERLNLDEPFYLWLDNLETFNCWLAIQTQWRTGGMEGRRIGLDYAGVEAFLRMRQAGRKERSQIFFGLQAMERAALDEYSKLYKR